MPILSSASAKASTSDTADSTNDDMIKLVEYELIAFIIHQCDNRSYSSSRLSSSVNRLSFSGSSANNPKSSSVNHNNSCPRCKRTMIAQHLCMYMPKMRCDGCVMPPITLLLCNSILLLVALDSRDLFTSFLTQRISDDKSIRVDVNVIWYEFETHHVDEIVWILGQVNLTDPGTKTDSPLTQSLLQTMSNEKNAIDLSKHESRRSDLPLR